MDLRVGQRPPVEPPPEPALLALQHPQHLHHHLLFAAGLPQRSVEPMRVKSRAPRTRGGFELRPQPPSLPSASPRPSAQSSTPCPFLGGCPCPQLPMDTPVPQLQVGQQEQELRQLLNKDKSKRSKDPHLRAGVGLLVNVGGASPKGWGPRLGSRLSGPLAACTRCVDRAVGGGCGRKATVHPPSTHS